MFSAKNRIALFLFHFLMVTLSCFASPVSYEVEAKRQKFELLLIPVIWTVKDETESDIIKNDFKLARRLHEHCIFN